MQLIHLKEVSRLFRPGMLLRKGIHRVDPDVKTVVRTLADGGEGTVQALTEGLGGQFVSVPVTGPAPKDSFVYVWRNRTGTDSCY